MDALKVFMSLPHLDGYQRVISELLAIGGTPLIYTISIVNGMLVGFIVKKAILYKISVEKLQKKL